MSFLAARIEVDHDMFDVLKTVFDSVMQVLRYFMGVGKAHASVKRKLYLEINIVSEQT